MNNTEMCSIYGIPPQAIGKYLKLLGDEKILHLVPYNIFFPFLTELKNIGSINQLILL